MVHNIIGKYEMPFLNTAIENIKWEARLVSNDCGQGLGSDSNGALTTFQTVLQLVQNHRVKCLVRIL